MTMRRVNRIALDGSTVAICFGRQQVACLKASYGDKIETSTHSNMGSQKIDARTRGTYATDECKISMESTVFRAEFMPLLQSVGFGNEQISLVIAYYHPDLGDDSDLLYQARIVGLNAATENSNKAFEVEFGIVFNQLFWGNNRLTINALDPSIPLSASGF